MKNVFEQKFSVMLSFAMSIILPMIIGCQHHARQVEKLDFVLYVTNQSHEINPVDVKIMIDGKEIMSDNVFVLNKHTWRAEKLQLALGNHEIIVESKNANVVFSSEFQTVTRHWAVIRFVYSPKISIGQTPHFKFKISDRPIRFL